MQHLTELRNIITRQKIKRINILQGHKIRSAKTLLAKFYNALLEGKIQNDEEASKLLYNASSSDQRYKLLKTTLKKRMLNTLFFIEMKKDKFSIRKHAEMACYKYLALINILKHFGANQTIVYLAEKIVRISEKYELIIPSLDALGILCNYYAIRTDDSKKLTEYQNKLKKNLKLYQLEVMLKNEFYTLVHKFSKNKSAIQPMVKQAQKKCSYIKELIKNANSDNVIYYSTMIQIIALSGPEGLDERIKICKDALRKIDKKAFIHLGTKLGIITNLALTLISKNDYKEGEKTIKNGLEIVRSGSFNWFKIQELYFMLCMHTERYEKADQILQEVLSTKQFKKTPDYIQELWIINQAYIYLLKETNVLPQNLKKHHSFKVAKFFNEVPVFSKDKRGVNVPILIIQYIFWLNRGKTAQIIDRVESLKQYTYKHLRDPHLKRSNLFLKILCTIPSAQFHPELVQRKTQKWQQQLFNTPLDLNDQPFEIEIIPYEKLWEIIQKIISEKQLTLYRSQKRQRK